jgi:ATP-binding cassette, subfamily C, bacterial CydCD
MRPLDPRLLRHARGAAVSIGVLGGLAELTACLVIAQAWLLAGAITSVFIDKSTLRLATLAALVAVTVARAAVAWASHAVAHHASAAAKTRLRGSLLAHVIALGPGWRRGTAKDGTAPDGAETHSVSRDSAALSQLATTGLDGLDGYFTSYLPALIGAVAVPLTVLVTITVADPLSGVAVLVTLPLVPLFGALIGMATRRHAQARWRALATLAHHFHDVVSGLPTLRVFGRAGAQRAQIERVTREYRRATMATLRLAFLSSFALELIATMSVALVATEIGLRLAYGHLDLRTGLLVLILAPEAYLPLRNLGSQFHATADGLAAAEEVFEILETPAAPAAGADLPSPRPAGAGLIRVDGVTVCHDGRADPAPDGATFTIAGGRLTVVTGPSGCGKSTLISCLLGFTEPTAGAISPRPGRPWVPPPLIGNGPVAAAAPDRFAPTGPDGHAPPLIGNGPVAAAAPDRSAPTGPDGHTPLGAPGLAAAWLPQEPVLFAGTVGGNIRLGWPDAPDSAVAAAAKDAALDDVPLDAVLGERGTGVSSGQRRRIALARALLPAAPVLLLDEPTAGLDAGREAVVIATLRRRARAGTAVVVVSHRPAVTAAGDEVVGLRTRTGNEAPAGPELPAEVPA